MVLRSTSGLVRVHLSAVRWFAVHKGDVLEARHKYSLMFENSVVTGTGTLGRGVYTFEM